MDYRADGGNDGDGQTQNCPHCGTEGERSVNHPPIAAYSDEEFEVIVEDMRGGWKVDDPVEEARARIAGDRGHGPHCESCEMKPAGVTTFSTDNRLDWGQLTWYRCLRCGTEQLRARRSVLSDK